MITDLLKGSGNVKKFFAFITAVMLLCCVALFPVSAQNTESNYYTYQDGKIIASVPAYTLSRIIDEESFNGIVGIKSIDDIAVTNDSIYLLDKKSSSILKIDRADYSFQKSTSKIYNADGTVASEANGDELQLNEPEGIFVSRDSVYVADTGAKRIVVLNKDDLTLEKIISKPKNFTGDTDFKPSKIVVSTVGNIYFTVSGTTEGIVELDSNGYMMRYFGANTPDYNIIEYFWKNFATKEQLAKMSKTYAPSFSNINIDSDDMVYAVSNDSTSEDMIFRFNAKGENIICERDGQPLVGDDASTFVHTDSRSCFVDIAVSDCGVYAVLDKSLGRVFIYNYNGYLLNIFSSLGDNYGQLKNPSAIEWMGDDLIVTDSDLGLAYIFTVTDFGALMMDAERSYYNGKWKKSAEKYEAITKINANYYVAYSGLGYSCLMNGKYKESIKYFKISNDKEGYSKAYNAYRGELIEKYFAIFAVIAILLIFLIIFSEVCYHRKNRGKTHK